MEICNSPQKPLTNAPFLFKHILKPNPRTKKSFRETLLLSILYKIRCTNDEKEGRHKGIWTLEKLFNLSVRVEDKQNSPLLLFSSIKGAPNKEGPFSIFTHVACCSLKVCSDPLYHFALNKVFLLTLQISVAFISIPWMRSQEHENTWPGGDLT